MHTAGAGAVDLLAAPPLDNANIDPRQRQFARQHQPRRAASDNHHGMSGHTPPQVPPVWFRLAIVRHEPGLAASPHVGYRLKVEGAGTPFSSLSAVDEQLRSMQRRLLVVKSKVWSTLF